MVFLWGKKVINLSVVEGTPFSGVALRRMCFLKHMCLKVCKAIRKLHVDSEARTKCELVVTSSVVVTGYRFNKEIFLLEQLGFVSECWLWNAH